MQRRTVLIGIVASAASALLAAARTDAEDPGTPVTDGRDGGTPAPSSSSIAVSSAIFDPRPFSLSAAASASPIPVTPGRADRAVTVSDNDRTILVATGTRLLLALGAEREWAVQIDDPTVLSPVGDSAPPEATQGFFDAVRAGQATLTAIGDLPCRRAQPPCLGAPTLLFRAWIVVT